MCAVQLSIIGQSPLILPQPWLKRRLSGHVCNNLFIGLGDGNLILFQRFSMLIVAEIAVADRCGFASVLALLNIVGSVGGATRSSLSSAIYIYRYSSGDTT